MFDSLFVYEIYFRLLLTPIENFLRRNAAVEFHVVFPRVGDFRNRREIRHTDFQTIRPALT